jgi:ribosomal protein S30
MNKIQVEAVPNPDMRTYHSEAPFDISIRVVGTNFPLKGANTQMGVVTQRIIEKLDTCPGVVQATIYPTAITLTKSPIFQWEEIEPYILRVLETQGKTRKKAPRIVAKIEWQRVPNHTSVNFYTTFAVSDVYIACVYLDRMSDNDRIGSLGQHVLGEVLQWIRKAGYEPREQSMHEYQVGVGIVTGRLSDEQCLSLSRVICTAAGISDCTIDEMPMRVINMSSREPPEDWLPSYML